MTHTGRPHFFRQMEGDLNFLGKWKSTKQAQLCNKLRLRRHLLHKRWAWPRRRALNGPSAR